MLFFQSPTKTGLCGKGNFQNLANDCIIDKQIKLRVFMENFNSGLHNFGSAGFVSFSSLFKVVFYVCTSIYTISTVLFGLSCKFVSEQGL